MDKIVDTIQCLEKEGESLYKEKGSKFFAFAFHVENEEDVKLKLNGLKKIYHDARHHCYAYVIGEHKDKYRVNDDGEPKNSAGMPIYGQIRSYDLTNTLIIVVRYFGGTKLGISGLIQAYKEASMLAIENAGIITVTVEVNFTIKFKYEVLNTVKQLLKKYNIKIIKQSYELDCEMFLSLPKAQKSEIKREFLKIYNLELIEEN